MQIQPSAPTRRRLGEALDRRLPYGSSSMAGGSVWDLPSTDYPRLPGASSAIRQPRPPAGRASFLGKPAHGHTVWTDCAARTLRLPQPTGRPGHTEPSTTQLPPPPPRTDSVLTTDQSQQTTAPDMGLRGKEPGKPDDPGRAAVIKGPVSSPSRQSYTSLQASGRSGGTSRRAPDWNPLANLANHRSGGWKKDLDFYMGAYFRLNYRNEPTSKWPALKAKFFNFLIDHHSEWNSIGITIRSGTSRTWRHNSSG